MIDPNGPQPNLDFLPKVGLTFVAFWKQDGGLAVSAEATCFCNSHQTITDAITDTDNLIGELEKLETVYSGLATTAVAGLTATEDVTLRLRIAREYRRQLKLLEDDYQRREDLDAAQREIRRLTTLAETVAESHRTEVEGLQQQLNDAETNHQGLMEDLTNQLGTTQTALAQAPLNTLVTLYGAVINANGKVGKARDEVLAVLVTGHEGVSVDALRVLWEQSQAPNAATLELEPVGGEPVINAVPGAESTS